MSGKMTKFKDLLVDTPNRYTVNGEVKTIVFAPNTVTQEGTKDKAEYFNEIQKNGLYNVNATRVVEGTVEFYDIVIEGSDIFDVFDTQFIINFNETNTKLNPVLRFNGNNYYIRALEGFIDVDVQIGSLQKTYIGFLDSANNKLKLMNYERKLTFDTVEDMQTATWLVAGDTIQLLGYYTKNDGAGHYRKISSTNNGSGIQIGVLFANLLNSNYVDVTHAGADNSYTIDSSSKIQQALNFCTGHLHFPVGVYKVSTKNFDYSIFNIGKPLKITGVNSRYTEILIDNFETNVNIFEFKNSTNENGLKFLSIEGLNVRPIIDYSCGHCFYYEGKDDYNWLAQFIIKNCDIGKFGKEGIKFKNTRTSPEWVGYQTGGVALFEIYNNYIKNGIMLDNVGDSIQIKKNVINSDSDIIGKNFIGIKLKNLIGSSLNVIEDNNITCKGGSVALIDSALRCKINRNNCELDSVKNENANSIILVSSNDMSRMSNIEITSNSLQDLAYVNDLAPYCDDLIYINNAKVSIEKNSILGISNGIKIQNGYVSESGNIFGNKLIYKKNVVGGYITNYNYKLTEFNSSGNVYVRYTNNFENISIFGSVLKGLAGYSLSGIPIFENSNDRFSIVDSDGKNSYAYISNKNVFIKEESLGKTLYFNNTLATNFSFTNEV